jgi:hypothetical protein
MLKKTLLALALAFGIGAVPVSAQITIPNTFTASTTISSASVNSNFTTLGNNALNRSGGTITGNILVDASITIDGADISDYLLGSGKLRATSSSADAILVTGGGTFGSGVVALIDTSGRITALTSVYIADLDGNAFTNLNASNLGTGTAPVNRGGTGLASYAVGDLIYASASTTLAKLADVAVGSVLVSGGVGVAPAWDSTPTISGLITAQAGITLTGTTPTLKIGDAGAENTAIHWLGAAFNFYMCLEDTSDDIVMGLGLTCGTTPALSFDENRDVTIARGLTIGTGTVSLVDATGKITAFSPTYFADSVTLTSNLGFTFQVDANNDSADVVSILNGASASMFNLTEAGVLTDITITTTEITDGTVSTADLNTGTTSQSSATANVEIVMNDYSFFPNQDLDDCAGADQVVIGITGANVTNDNIGRGRMVFNDLSNTTDCTSGTRDIRWRFMTASDHPQIWMIANADGTIQTVWQSSDVVNPSEWPANPNPLEGSDLVLGQYYLNPEIPGIPQFNLLYAALTPLDRAGAVVRAHDYVVEKRGWLSDYTTPSDLVDVVPRYRDMAKLETLRAIAYQIEIDPAELIIELMVVVGDELETKSNLTQVLVDHLAYRASL